MPRLRRRRPGFRTPPVIFDHLLRGPKMRGQKRIPRVFKTGEKTDIYGALRQISSAEVVQRLVEIAGSLREAGRRHEQLGLTAEEAAFYDALAGDADAPNVDPQLAKIARDLVKSIREDLTVDLADRASTEAAIRRKIRRLLREHEYKPPVAPPGGGSVRDINHFAQLVLDQAKTLYRYWPDVERQAVRVRSANKFPG